MATNVLTILTSGGLPQPHPLRGPCTPTVKFKNGYLLCEYQASAPTTCTWLTLNPKEQYKLLRNSSWFFENQPTKFAVIWVKRRHKACFLSPRSSTITATKKKERRKRKSEEKRKKAMVALLIFIIATLEAVFVVFSRKNSVRRKRTIMTFSKIRLELEEP